MSVVIITGASRGIGLAVTHILLRDFRATVIALSRTRSPELAQLSEHYPHSLSPLECNVTDATAVTDAIKLVLHTHGHIDALVLNAAVLEPFGRIASPETSLDAWKSHFDVNFFSLLTAVQAVLPALRQSSGRIIFVSSGFALAGSPGTGAYNASKAAMNSLCRTLASEEPDVVSIAVRPGKVDTAMQALIRSDAKDHMNEHNHAIYVNAYAEGKLVRPEQCGHVIAALALNAPRALSGQFVSWDGDECKEFRTE